MNHRTSRRSIRRFAAAGALAAVVAPALSVAAAGSASAATSCTYTVSGKVVTTDNRLELTDTFGNEAGVDALSADTALAGAKVRVATSWSGLGVFDVWSEKTLGSDGSFSFSKTWTGVIDCGVKRDYRVDVQFEDSEVKIGTAPWYTVKKDSGANRSAGSHNLGTLRFSSSNTQEAGGDDARIAAETWVVVHRAVDFVQSLGLPYTQKITVHNPNRTITGIVPDGTEGSYTDPASEDTAYIADDAKTEVGTILHEIGHLWAYQHATGEECLTEAWWEDFSTHDETEDPCVAFHEGFASYYGDMLAFEMEQADQLNGTAVYPDAFTRNGLSNLSDFWTGPDFPNIDNLADVQRSEWGWMDLFRLLDQRRLKSQVFGSAASSVDTDADGSDDFFVESSTGSGAGSVGSITSPTGPIVSSSCVSAPDLSFANVLTIFGSSMDTSSPTVEDLLSRADSKLSNFSSTDEANFKTLIDPAKTAEPSSMYC